MNQPSEYQPVMIALSEGYLGQIRQALEAGLEAAEERYDIAKIEYGIKRPILLRAYAGEVTKLKEALWVLRQHVPSIFPLNSENAS